jgi:hypothetical protein
LEKIPHLLIVSRYNEPWEWVKAYTDNYMIFNKGKPILNNPQVINLANVGNNQRDILMYCETMYYDLPKTVAFVQAVPWDHCNRETFNKLIYNTTFTALEDYSHVPESYAHKKAEDGGYMEINNSWYIESHNRTFGLTCKYSSYDEFMNHYFVDYTHVPYIRFAPGAQYIVPKKNILFYPFNLWLAMMDELPENNMTVGHIIERALYTIFTNQLIWREEFD